MIWMLTPPLFRPFLVGSYVHHRLTLFMFPPPSENTLLAGEDIAQSLRAISEKKLLDKYRLVSKIENTMNKFLIGYQHVCSL